MDVWCYLQLCPVSIMYLLKYEVILFMKYVILVEMLICKHSSNNTRLEEECTKSGSLLKYENFPHQYFLTFFSLINLATQPEIIILGVKFQGDGYNVNSRP